jgi:L-alanine-DL-glutamate epimerase-like enolase superfamily enzyme
MPSTMIAGVDVMTIAARLPAPVIFGDWVMDMREFALVRVRTAGDGPDGLAYTLTRDGAVAEQIRKMVGPIYTDTAVADREATYTLAWRRSLASHAAGIGLRALSIVDLACWDLAAKLADRSIADLLGGHNQAMPATAIIGYPPGEMGPAETGSQTAELYAAGWRRFKAPIGGSAERSAARLRAARAAAPDAWLGMDGAWVYEDVETAADFANSIPDVDLGWFEDVFPPGDARKLAELRRRTSVPIAQGDEQGGLYYPEALVLAEAVDVVRVDLTCMGGITGGRRIIDETLAAGLAFAPHMFPHVHSQVLSAWGYTDVPIEWGMPFTGVHPMDDSLPQPVITEGGLMQPLDEAPGFGHMVDADWVRSQPHDDPAGILADL